MMRALLYLLALLPSIALAQSNASMSTPGTPASQAVTIQGNAASTSVGVGIDYSNDFGATAPSGNAISGLSPDPGGNLVSGSPYSHLTGCAILKNSSGNLFEVGATITGLTGGHTYYLLVLDSQFAPASPTTIVNGSMPGNVAGVILPPILVPANGYIAPIILSPPIVYYTGLTICISDNTVPLTFTLPSPAVLEAGVTILANHL